METDLPLEESSLVRGYRETGIFFCADYLREKGISAPSRVVVVVGECLKLSASAQLPRLKKTQTPQAYVATCLDWTLAHSDLSMEGRFDSFAEHVKQEVPWDAYTDFAELLNLENGPQTYEVARRRFAARGLAAGIDFFRDVAVGFVDAALPSAVRSFDLAREGKEAAWLTTVFLRYALPRLLAQRSVDLEFQALADLRSPDTVFEEAEREALTKRVGDALAGLDESLALPIRMYFGFENPDKSVRQVARGLGTSEYHARLRIVRGLAAVAARLNAPGVLDARELNVARELFVVGSPLESVARRLKLRPTQVRASLASLEAKLATAIKESRTSLTDRDSEGVDMSVARERLVRRTHRPDVKPQQIVVRPDWEAIVKAIIRSQGRVEPFVGAGGEYCARVNGLEFSVTAFVAAMNERADLKDVLESSDVELGWLITPPPNRDRKNLAPDFEAWNAALEELSSRPWTVATALFERWQEAASARGIALFDDRAHVAEPVEHVLAVLSIVLSGLEERLPRATRRSGRGTLVVTRGDFVTCAWEGASTEPIDLGALAGFAVHAVEVFTPDSGSLLADLITSEIAAGDLVIPGFRLAEQLSDGARFTWESQSVRLPATTSA